MEKTVTLKIDKHEVTVPAGTIILDAAKNVGIDIPTLCYINLEGTAVKSNPSSCN